jgi:hypothetical protein
LGAAGLARRQDFFVSAFPFFILAAVFLAMPLFMRRAVLKVYAQKPDRDMLVTYEFSDRHIASRSDVASSEMLWQTIIRAHKVPEGFLLYITDRAFHWLPVHGFQGASEVERLAQLTASKVRQYQHSF